MNPGMGDIILEGSRARDRRHLAASEVLADAGEHGVQLFAAAARVRGTEGHAGAFSDRCAERAVEQNWAQGSLTIIGEPVLVK